MDDWQWTNPVLFPAAGEPSGTHTEKKIHRGLSSIMQKNVTYSNHSRQRHQNEDDRLEPLYVNEQTHTKINLTLKDGKIVLTPPSMLLFRDNRNQLYATTKFFHKTIYIKELGSPGPVRIEVFKGFLYILLVFGFLAFVALIIHELGDDYDLSTAVQFLLLLAGGLIPYVIRYCSTPVEKSGESKEEFCRLLENASKTHTESWFVSDITLGSIGSRHKTKTDIVVVVDEPSTSVQEYIRLYSVREPEGNQE